MNCDNSGYPLLTNGTVTYCEKSVSQNFISHYSNWQWSALGARELGGHWNIKKACAGVGVCADSTCTFLARPNQKDPKDLLESLS
jgi:hypothetical protein